ncbi:MAG TPA: hypothetical protein DGG95_00905 [Cytophagales bacterium]|jgi:hypothetical protein|nr:hypothetical protein [Cytophagales bacterium]
MINVYENTLRSLINDIIGSDDNAPYKISEERISKWKEKREIEHKKNNGIPYENRLIYYSDFYDLKTIILKNWELFLPILLDKKRFDVFFSEVENYRNTVAHGRNLISSQENLLKGITFDLRNLITIYHNKNEMKEDFFIEILRINDNLGNIWGNASPAKNPVLRVGDQYELFIEANDPKDREIEYEIFLIGEKFRITQTKPRINFVIESSMISKMTTLYLKARTPNSEYKNEALKTISVTILPK